MGARGATPGLSGRRATSSRGFRVSAGEEAARGPDGPGPDATQNASAEMTSPMPLVLSAR